MLLNVYLDLIIKILDICSVVKIFYKVIFCLGLKFGDFFDYGEVFDMNVCVKYCCV